MGKVEKHVGGLNIAHGAGAGKPKRKKLHRLEVSRAKNGGHVVRHHYRGSMDMPFSEPTEHVFGRDQGEALLAHLARHLGVPKGAAAPADAGTGEEETTEDA